MKSHQRIQHHLKPTNKKNSCLFITLHYHIFQDSRWTPIFLNVRWSGKDVRVTKIIVQTDTVGNLMFSRQRQPRRVCKETVVGRDPATPGMYNRPAQNFKILPA